MAMGDIPPVLDQTIPMAPDQHPDREVLLDQTIPMVMGDIPQVLDRHIPMAPDRLLAPVLPREVLR